MKYTVTIFFLTLSSFQLQAQDSTIVDHGVVSFISSKNIYVKFQSTENIKVGDTLFVGKENTLEPVLIVSTKSSISCLCTPITSKNIAVSQGIIARSVVEREVEITPEEAEAEVVEGNPEPVLNNSTPLAPLERRKARSESHLPSFREAKSFVGPRNFQISNTIKEDPTPVKEKDDKVFKQNLKGRISAASYSSISDYRTNHSLRYTFSLRGDHLGNSRLSVDSYINFRHTLKQWEEVNENLNSALKIYSLALKYDFGKATSMTIGRKINSKISSMGAIDGIQLEKKQGKLLLGAILGSRPDYRDYGFNPDLLQFGGYISLASDKKARYHQTTLGFIEQRNNSKIDRRFVYFQHSSALLENLNVFTSMEMSLYEILNEKEMNRISLSNLFVSMRYKFSRKLNLSVSYDNRKNIIYYESYKSFIDKLIEDETRQGVRFHINYRPLKNVIWGVNTGWRFQKSANNLSKNLNTYLTFSRVPKLNLSTTFSANFLQTNYLNSKIFGVRISKEIIDGLLSADVNFRVVDYQYLNYENTTHQNIGGINFSMNIFKKLTFYMYYEGIFDTQYTNYNRFNTKIIQRF